MLCPICTEFQMTENIRESDVYYKNKPYKLTLEFSFCPVCGEQDNPDQIYRNAIKKRDLRDRIDGEDNG